MAVEGWIFLGIGVAVLGMVVGWAGQDSIIAIVVGVGIFILGLYLASLGLPAS